MQEEVENKTVNLAITTGKLTIRAILKGLSAYVHMKRNKKLQKSVDKEKDPVGKQTVKELIGQGQGVTSIDIAKVGLRDFEKVAKKYGVDFAIKKDKTVDPPKYICFFKAKDVDALNQVVKEYSKKQLNKTVAKASVLAKLKKFKDIVASLPQKVKEKKKEQVL